MNLHRTHLLKHRAELAYPGQPLLQLRWVKARARCAALPRVVIGSARPIPSPPDAWVTWPGKALGSPYPGIVWLRLEGEPRTYIARGPRFQIALRPAVEGPGAFPLLQRAQGRLRQLVRTIHPRRDAAVLGVALLSILPWELL